MPPEIDAAHRKLVQTVFDAWRPGGQWPTWNYLDHALEDYGLDADELLKTLPAGLLSASALRIDRRDRVTMSIAGVYYCDHAQAQKDAFMKLFLLAVETDKTYRPSAWEGDDPEISEDQIIGVGISKNLLTSLQGLMQSDHWIGYLAVDGSDVWHFSVSRRIKFFRPARTLEEYVGLREKYLNPGGSAAREEPRLLFVLMPFRKQYEPVYAAIKLAAENAGGFFCQRSDDITKPGRISLQILQAIGDADLIVADLSEHNPNVMYELGFAHALGKPTILLAPARFKSPFDIFDWRQIRYSPVELTNLAEKLGAWLTASQQDWDTNRQTGPAPWPQTGGRPWFIH